MKPKHCTGAEGSPSGPLSHSMDKPPHKYVADKETSPCDESGLCNTEPMDESLCENQDSLAKRFV